MRVEKLLYQMHVTKIDMPDCMGREVAGLLFVPHNEYMVARAPQRANIFDRKKDLLSPHSEDGAVSRLL